jgi:Flagellar assembly protein FliH
MSLSNDRARPKSLRFIDVTAEARAPGWLSRRNEEPYRAGPGEQVDRLVPPEVPSHERPAWAPILESVRPPAARPSQFPSSAYPASQHPGPYRASQFPNAYPSSPPGPPSQFPGAGEAPGVEPFALGGVPERRTDTLVEDLVPRAEEEAVTAITTAVDRLQRERQEALAGVELELAQLITAICRRVLLTELNSNPLLIERLVQAGLEALAGGDKLTVRLGPFFADAAPILREQLEHRGVNSVVLVDPSIGAQGCQLSSELGRVDEAVTARLDVLLANLGLSG